VYVKDGRYKYVLSNLRHQSSGAAAGKGFRSGGPLEQDDVRLTPLFFGNKQWNNVRQQANSET
jgi:hypothetical protein